MHPIGLPMLTHRIVKQSAAEVRDELGENEANSTTPRRSGMWRKSDNNYPTFGDSRNLQIALGLGTIDQESQLQDKWLTDERAAPRGSGAAGTAFTACEIQLDLDDADNSFITAGLRFPEHVRVQAIIPAGHKEPLGTQSRVCSGLY